MLIKSLDWRRRSAMWGSCNFKAVYSCRQLYNQLINKPQKKAEILDSSLATKGDINGLKGDVNRLEKEILLLKGMTGFMLAGVLSLILKAFFIS